MFADKLTTAALAVMLVLAATVPGAAAGGPADASGRASGSMTVTVATTEDATVVTFERAGEAYSGADVEVEAVGDASYEGSGSYETDANGSVVLPNPDGQVTVRVQVEGDDLVAGGVVTLSAYGGVETETTVTLEAAASADASSVGDANVDSGEPADDGDEAEGDSMADSGGEADARAENSAAAEGGANASADANGDGHVSFGERLSSFVGGLASVDLGGIGDVVSSFAIGNNPAEASGGSDASGSARGSAEADASGTADDGRAGAGGSAEGGVSFDLFG